MSRNAMSNGCKIYLHDAAAAVSYTLPPHLKPMNWQHNRYSQEQWLSRAMRNHPWRTLDVADADLIFLAAKFSQLCTVKKTYASRYLWHLHLNDSLICNGTATGRDLEKSNGNPLCRNTLATPKLMVLTNTECTPPWEGWGGPWQPPSKPNPDFLMAVDRLTARRGMDRAIVLPAVVAGPRWLVADSSSSSIDGGSSEIPATIRSHLERPWADRRLLFFPGHIPKLYVQRRRFDIWNQIRSHKLVTATSHTLNCTVGSYRICMEPHRIVDEYKTFCLDACADVAKAGPRGAVKGTFARQGGLICAARNARMLRSQCSKYRDVNFRDQALLRDLERDSRFLNQEQYLSAAFSHRFCLAVPGDFMSASPKITEFIAVGAAGGCIPVFVVPRDAYKILPHSPWLDYCEIGFLVFESKAHPANMAAALARLENVTWEEATAKHQALRRIRDAFVWREPGDGPVSAADYALRAACDLARRWKRERGMHGPATGRLKQPTSPSGFSAHVVDGGAAGMLPVGGRCVLA